MPTKVLTWEEKLQKGIPLNELERTKYDATRITLRRIREQEEEEKANALRQGAFDPSDQEVIAFAQKKDTNPADESDTDSETDLSQLKRADLEAMAEELGVENVSDIPNKPSLIEAINQKKGE